MNSVVILFITDLDELLFDIYMALDMSPEKNSSSEVLVNENTTLQANMETMNEKMEKMQGDMAELQMTMNQLLGIKTPPSVPQDEPAVHLKGGADASCLEKTVANMEDDAHRPSILSHRSSSLEKLQTENLELKEELQQLKNVVQTLCERFDWSEFQMVLKETSVANNDTAGVSVSGSEISAVRGSLAKGGLALREWMEDQKK